MGAAVDPPAGQLQSQPKQGAMAGLQAAVVVIAVVVVVVVVVVVEEEEVVMVIVIYMPY